MNNTARTYLLAVVGLSAVLWNLGFNLGAFGAVFYEGLFFVWVACTTILIGSFFLPRQQRPFGAFGAGVMFVPSIWLILQAWDTVAPSEVQVIDLLILFLAVVVTMLSLPYAARVLISVMVSESLSISSRRLRITVIAIATAAGLAGYLIGANNYLFLTCQDFKVSGNDLPANCRPAAVSSPKG